VDRGSRLSRGFGSSSRGEEITRAGFAKLGGGEEERRGELVDLASDAILDNGPLNGGERWLRRCGVNVSFVVPCARPSPDSHIVKHIGLQVGWLAGKSFELRGDGPSQADRSCCC